MNVLYIHGFNSGKGQKVVDLENAGFKVYCPQLTNNVKEDIQKLVDLANQLKDEDLHIVGCSLGGFYALVLVGLISSNRNVVFHAINPSIKPYISLKKELNKTLINYKTNVEFTVTQLFLDDLKEACNHIIGLQSNEFELVRFYFGSEDTVIDHSKTIDWIHHNKIPSDVITAKQGHRFQDISTIITEISEYDALKK